jgi:hypothetical protein
MMEEAPWLPRLWIQRAVIAMASMAVFVTSLNAPLMQWDDEIYVTDSPRIHRAGLAGLRQLWSPDDAFNGRFLEFFPLRDTVYWVTWQWVGENAVAFHIVNILAHALVGLLVLELARRLGLTPTVSFWGALLFAVHPIHVESVTWISALKDPMFAGLMVCSVLFFLRYREHKRPGDYALCVLFMVASLLAKSIALATPLLFLVIDRWLEPRPRWWVSLARAAGPAVIAAGFLMQFVLIGRANAVISGPHGGSWGQHYFLMAWALVRYVQQAVVPATFRIHYCFVPLEGPFDLRLLGIAGLLVGVCVALWLPRRRAPLIPLLILWFFICLLPVANIVPFPAIMADRYLYAPSIAACLLISWGVGRLTAPKAWALLALVVVFGGVTLLRGAIWQEPANLWAEAVEDDACLKDDVATAAVMYLNYASTVEDPQLALAAYKKGINHRRFRVLRPDLQIAYLRKALEVAYRLGDPALARRWSDLALRIGPLNPDVWRSRAAVIGDPKLALDAAEHAFRLQRSADTYWQLGEAKLAMNDLAGIDDVTKAVVLEPDRFCPYLLEWLERKHAETWVPSFASIRARCAPGP